MTDILRFHWKPCCRKRDLFERRLPVDAAYPYRPSRRRKTLTLSAIALVANMAAAATGPVLQPSDSGTTGNFLGQSAKVVTSPVAWWQRGGMTLFESDRGFQALSEFECRGAELVDLAGRAVGFPGLADRPPVEDHHVIEHRPVLARDDRHQVLFDLDGVFVPR